LGLEEKYDEVQKLIDIGKEKGYLLYDEVSDLLPPELTTSAEDLDDLFTAFGTAGIEVIDTAAVFASHRDPASLYTMRINNHPDVAGHQLIGRTIVDELNKRRLPKLSARH